jgi:hypothetical protein
MHPLSFSLALELRPNTTLVLMRPCWSDEMGDPKEGDLGGAELAFLLTASELSPWEASG